MLMYILHVVWVTSVAKLHSFILAKYQYPLDWIIMSTGQLKYKRTYQENISELYILDKPLFKVNVLLINMSKVEKCLLVVSSHSQAT